MNGDGEQPKISIITPCLNAEDTVARTVESVLGQAYENIEYMVIDGESNDDTLKILRGYSEADPRMRVLSRSDRSMTEALNRGLNLVDGDVVGSINADDWYVEGALATVAECFRSQKFDCLIGKTRHVEEDGRTKFETAPSLARYRWAWHLMGCLTPESSVFFSRNCVSTLGEFNESLKYTQDFEYYLRVLDTFDIVYVDAMLSNFYRRDEQASTRFHETMEREVLSYVDRPLLRKLVGGTSAGSAIRVLLGQRRYDARQLLRHLREFVTG